MARTTKKKDPAPEVQEQTAAQEETTPLQEADATQEAHLDPAQFEDMDDATLQGLAQDLGLDPAAYEGRDALIAAIAAVPVIPGPPEAEPDPEPEDPAPEITPAQEPPAGTTPDPEPVPAQEDPAPVPEQQQDPEPIQDPDPDPEPDPVPPGERTLPYKAAVAVSLATVHKAVGLGTADMLKAVGTLKQGTTVTVTGRMGTYARLINGLYILEAFLEVQPIS